jgi:hypothetical protein
MTEKESTINKYFWSDFSKIYKKPSLIDDHLIKNSNLIEATLIKNFTELESKLFNLREWWFWKERNVSII